MTVLQRSSDCHKFLPMKNKIPKHQKKNLFKFRNTEQFILICFDIISVNSHQATYTA